MSIYFDYNATTPLAPSVIEKIGEALRTKWGNPSSSYSIGINAKESIDEARAHVASMIQAKPEDIIFTSGGTEANNMVIFGILEYFKRFTDTVSSTKIPKNDNTGKPHVITTNVEHDAVILPLRYLERRGDIDLSIVPVASNGRISVEDVMSHVKQKTCLITVMHANNETGVIMPVVEIGRSLKKLNNERKSKGYVRILYHTDSAQAIGKITVDVNELHVDYLTIVGHKFYGPRIGALFVRGPASVSPIQPMFYGGGQERGWRPGTENTPMIVGLGEAARLVHDNLHSYQDHMLSIRTYLEEKLMETFGKDNIRFNCSSSDRLPNTSNISLVGNGLYGHVLLSKCQFLTASIGAACHKQNKPSGILLASGIQAEMAANAIRLSVGRDTTKGDVDSIVSDLLQAVTTVQKQHKETNYRNSHENN
ncbi:hypothetical protein R5R35_007217 [Gryllus longicercus]|uniref:Selenocysteine lyase n=1 Tax=Gryllus longicercus TaxID=2509291 RepID=A0AAN9VFE5_9ORTH